MGQGEGVGMDVWDGVSIAIFAGYVERIGLTVGGMSVLSVGDGWMGPVLGRMVGDLRRVTVAAQYDERWPHAIRRVAWTGSAPGRYDIVHMRCDAGRVASAELVRGLCAAVRPGGVLYVEDYAQPPQAIHGAPPELGDAVTQVLRHLRRMSVPPGPDLSRPCVLVCEMEGAGLVAAYGVDSAPYWRGGSGGAQWVAGMVRRAAAVVDVTSGVSAGDVMALARVLDEDHGVVVHGPVVRRAIAVRPPRDPEHWRRQLLNLEL